MVVDRNEEESAGRRGGSRGGAVAGVQDVADVVGADVAAACFEKCADKVANHVVQKSRAAHAIDEQIARRASEEVLPGGFEEGADVSRGVSGGGAAA